MALQSELPTVPNTPLSNRNVDDEDIRGNGSATLPAGACNYTNLSAGGGGSPPRCGCRRFWAQSLGVSDGGSGASKSAFCMCEHHACFHDHDPEGHKRKASSDVRTSQGLVDTPKRLVTQQSIHMTGHLGGDTPRDQNIAQRTASDTPDTLQWSRFIHSGPPESLPAIPSQCLLPSENGSGTSASQSGYHRPFGGRGLDTLSHVPRTATNISSLRNEQPLAENTRALQVYEDANGNGFLQSLTEVATPSPRASPDIDADFGKNVTHVQEVLDKVSASHPQNVDASISGMKGGSDSQILIKQSNSHPETYSNTLAGDSSGKLLPRLRGLVESMSNFPNTMRNHEQRLDSLENASFTNPAIEDLQEGYNVLDLRICELEGRVDDVEHAQYVQKESSTLGSAAESFASRVSTTSSAMIAEAIDHVDPSRIETLEAQVAELQALVPPSHSRPWEIEVVFLPFGSDLMGLWSSASHFSSNQRSRASSNATDDWTQTQNNAFTSVQAQLAAHEDAAAWETSAIDFAPKDDASWYMARACGRRSKIDERLRSRGLVKLVQVYGPDARDVQAAIMSAFGDLPQILVEDPFTQREDKDIGIIPQPLSNYLGLQAPWIPLRKLHKDSCLRFLNTSEMITPALWTVQFLASSVAMRSSGTRRLYVTQGDSYIQGHGDNANWSWQKLRQLPRVYPDQSSLDHTPEADAHEPCWEFDERLDPPVESFQSSFASHISSLSIRAAPHEDEEPASPSDHFSSAAVSQQASTTPTSVAPPPSKALSPLRERNPFRPLHIRTASMPSIAPAKSSPSQPNKRRIASFDHEPQSSPTRIISTSIVPLTLKRRRISRSPSRPRDTPRWSTGPPSPFPHVEDGHEHSKRGTTPFAYATPHSNAPYIEGRPRSGGDIDIYQDEADEGDLGSTTDEFNLEAEGSGWDQNALSDYEPASSNAGTDDNGDYEAHQLDDEWQGVGDLDEDLTSDSRPVGVTSGARKAMPGSLRQDAEGEEEDAQSDTSSLPSEYPSTQQGLFIGPKTGFKIHVDDEVDELS